MLKKTFALMIVLSIIIVACQNNDSNAEDPKPKKSWADRMYPTTAKKTG